MRKRRSMKNPKKRIGKQEAQDKQSEKGERILKLRQLINNENYINKAVESIAHELTDALFDNK